MFAFSTLAKRRNKQNSPNNLAKKLALFAPLLSKKLMEWPSNLANPLACEKVKKHYVLWFLTKSHKKR